MNNDDDGELVDEAAGPIVRPYVSTGGRTAPSVKMDRMTLVCSTKTISPAHVDDYQAQVLALCGQTMSIAELAAHMRLPSMVIKILVSDLIDAKAVRMHTPEPYDDDAYQQMLQTLLVGLERRL